MITNKAIGIVFMMLTSMSLSSVFCQKNSYYINGKLTSYTISTDKIIVQLKENFNPDEWANMISPQKDILSISQLRAMGGYLILEFKGIKAADIESKISNFKKDEKIAGAFPFLINKDGNVIGALTSEFIVKLKKSTSFLQLEQFVEHYQVDISKQYEFDNHTYFLSVQKNSELDAMELSKSFYESGLFEYVEPNFMLFSIYGTNDTYYQVVQLTLIWTLMKHGTLQLGAIISGLLSLIVELNFCILTWMGI